MNLSSGAGLGGDAQGDTLSNIQNLVGGSFGDTLTGNGGANVLNGGVGADTMTGLGGDDLYSVDNAADKVFEAVGGGNDTVFVTSAISYTLAAGQEVEIMRAATATSTLAINLTGNAFGNRIFGDAGANVLDGGNGDDVLFGEGGVDMFEFDTALGASNIDRMPDFAVCSDTIDLSHVIFSPLWLGTLSSSAFFVGAAAQNANQHIIYNSGAGALFYDSDGNGAAVATRFATLATSRALSNTNFAVV